MKDNFDELLSAACEDIQSEDLASFHAIEAAPANIPHFTTKTVMHKKVYTVAAAIAATFLFATSAIAIWPKLSWDTSGGHIILTVENTPAGNDYTKMQVPLPDENYSIEELDENVELGYSRVRIKYSGKVHTGIGKGYKIAQKSFVVTQYSFASVEHEFTNETGGILSEDDKAELQESIALKSSADDIQPADILSKAAVYWTTGQSCYRFYREAEVYDLDEAEAILEILKSIKP